MQKTPIKNSEDPLKNPVCASVWMPGSKSYTNRALIMAALTRGPVCLTNPLYSEDTEAMIGCLRTLGLQIETEPSQIIVYGDIGCIEDNNYQLFAHDSGTTVRFVLALLCIVPGVKIIQGSKRLNERPISDLVDALRELGAKIEYCDKEGQLPVKVTTSILPGSFVHLKSDMSSQFCSAVLLISPCILKGLTIHVKGPLISKPYIDMTLSCMQDWGVSVIIQGEGNYFVPEHQCYQKKQYIIEGDFSSAGYFFAIAVLTKSMITLENLNSSSAQADRKFLDILAKMGNIVTYEENGIRIQGRKVVALDIDMEDCPDQVMTMAVLAAFAKGITKISGVRSLRVKETERVFALKKNLSKMGIRTEDTHDTLTIHGGSPHAAEIDTYDDHRIAMAFAVAGVYLPGIVIRHPEVVNKTFPTFWEVLTRVNGSSG
jgi:3-phosphoshikimate 1-carboxyvinyltransferase